MDNHIAKALETVRSVRTVSEEEYLAACTYLVVHRDQVPFRVFIDLPGGLDGNSDPRWDAVRAGTESRCGCGNERTILPAYQRQQYEPSASGEVVVSLGQDKMVCLRPVGGDKASTYMGVWIEGSSLAFMGDPFGPLVLTPDLFSTKGYALAPLAAAMEKKKGEPAVMYTGKKIPVFNVISVDAVKATVTIVPDKDVEVFDPEAEKATVHDCGS